MSDEPLRSRLMLRAGRVPRYVTIGDRDPQEQVRVTLAWPHGVLDVTRNHVIVSLRPLVVAIGAPNGETGVPDTSRARLLFSRGGGPGAPRSRTAATLGEIVLRPEGPLALGGASLRLYRVERYRNRCMPLAAAAVYTLTHAWAERRHRPSFQMMRRDRLGFEVLYICPRPVVLVSVRHEDADNLFPMDLIGPTNGPHFLMALRSTSPSVELMTGSGRISIADVPLEDAHEAIRLGDRHKKTRMDWDALPFETDRSPAHSFRVPAGALRVRDLAVREARPVGSHTLFVTEVIAERRRRAGLQMFNVSGSYYRYLRVRGVHPLRPS